MATRMRWVALLAVSILVATAVDGAGAQREDSVRANGGDEAAPSLGTRAARILNEALTKPLPVDEGERTQTVRALCRWPFPMVEQRAVELLSDPAPPVRIAAGEILVQGARDRYAPKVSQSVRNLQPTSAVDRALQAVLLLELDEPDMLERVRDWATLSPAVTEPANQWTCPFHPQIIAAEEAPCPICGIALVPSTWEPTAEWREAQLLALTALAERDDPLVKRIAHELLTGEVEPRFRQEAAIQWARMAPEQALPHVRLFLCSPEGSPRLDTLSGVVYWLPGLMTRELESIADDERRSEESRLMAMHGLVSAGRGEYLETARQLIDELDDPELVLAHWAGLELLGAHGSREDLARLTRYLDSDSRVAAAYAIVRLLNR